MKRKVSQRATAFLACAPLALGAIALFASPSLAYTTMSPEVLEMVDKAAGFLKKSTHNEAGGWALIGLALYKNEETSDDPKIQQAADKVVESIRKGVGELDIYSTGISLIFLTSYDPSRYEKEIQTLLTALHSKQKDHGGWGYPDRPEGDTSMTQYGVLGSWEAKRAGFKIPLPVVERVAAWLMKTQDPSGAWGYQGQVSDSAKLVNQSGIRHTMATAGLGSIYICGDFFGMTPEARNDETTDISLALKAVKERAPDGSEPRSKVKTSANLQAIRAAQSRGDGWIARNYTISPPKDALYYLYALERYGSFRQLAEGKGHQDPASVEGPKWYNEGVVWLKKQQRANGSWDCGGQCDEVVNTAFGVLFLLRSTQKSIRKSRDFGDGTMVGGMGLPEEGTEYLDVDGHVKKKTLAGRGTSLIGALDREDWATVADRFEQLKGTKREKLLLSEYEKKLSDPSPDERLKAVRSLIISGDMKHVPTLILALEDPNLEVALTARDGLRRLTRRINGFGMPDDPSPDDRHRAVEQWKAWYLSLRPDTEF